MFFISFFVAFFYFLLSFFININWVNEISCYFGYPFAIYIVLFIALIPGFMYVFMLISLLYYEKQKRHYCCKSHDVTVLIPTYNSKKTILKTINSIIEQKYDGRIHIIIIDDGSKDGTIELLKKQKLDCSIKLIETSHRGKSFALNEGLKYTKTKYVITVDSDTVLHSLAIHYIIKKLANSNRNTVATAGCLFVENDQSTFITKMQQWDYTLGIFGVKFYQGNYNSTLVAQGAFSAYKTRIIKKIGGWQPYVGEDIVLTWELLSRGYEVNFAKKAIAFTEVPTTLRGLLRQRKRWACGMIEAFKQVTIISSQKMNLKSKLLICMNIFFPFIDIALLIFIPLGLIFLVFHNYLFMSWLTLLVILLGMILCFVIEVKRRNVLKQIDCILKRRSFLAFLVYILLYAFLLAPCCIIGYIKGLCGLKKEW